MPLSVVVVLVPAGDVSGVWSQVISRGESKYKDDGILDMTSLRE